MKKIIFILILPFLLLGFFLVRNRGYTGAPPYYIDEAQTTPNPDRYAWIFDWERPEGPARVGLQVGHWKNDEIPKELERLRGNTGSSGGGKSEWEVNYEIAMLTKEILENEGITVDILPATVPVNYWADVFVAIHADGSEDLFKSGYKAAAPWRDFTGKSNKLVEFIENSYEESTLLQKDPEITRNMRGYYAFSFWRFDHAIHPMTVASILETGFLTNASDREILVDRPDLSAEGLSEGIINYLTSEELILL